MRCRLVLVGALSLFGLAVAASAQFDSRPAVRKPVPRRLPQPSGAPQRSALETDNELRLLRALQKRVSVEFKDRPLKEVIAELSAKCEIEIVVDSRGVAAEGVSPDAIVTFSASGERLSTLLDRLLAPAKLDYVVAEDSIKVTSRVRAKGELVTRTYKIAELVDRFGGIQRAAYSHESWGTQAGSRVRLGDDLDAAYGAFVVRLQKEVRPESWEQMGGPGSASFYARTGTLVVRQTQDVHEELQEYLDRPRRTGSGRQTKPGSK